MSLIVIFAKQMLDKNQHFLTFQSKNPSIIRQFAINFIILQQKDILLKRETPFTYHFRPVFHAEKRGFAEGGL